MKHKFIILGMAAYIVNYINNVSRQCLDHMCVEPRVELARVLDDINEFFSNRIGRKVLSLK